MLSQSGNATFDDPIRDAFLERRLSRDGHPFWVWRNRMPRIPDLLLDCVVFLYPTAEDAVNGEGFGGTGFIVAVPSNVDKNFAYSYIATNDHVIRPPNGQAAPVVRVNKQSGGFDILPLAAGDWFAHPDGDDLAICQLEMSDAHKYAAIYVAKEHDILSSELATHWKVGPGDDIFMVGRFINQIGKQTGTPVVRSGIISMMPVEKLPLPSGRERECFLIETRSQSGFSGSPVFVHINLYRNPDSGSIASQRDRTYLHVLLGIDCGNISNFEHLRSTAGGTENVYNEMYVRANTGMAVVIPAWRIWSLLFSDEMVARRKLLDQELTPGPRPIVVLDSDPN